MTYIISVYLMSWPSNHTKHIAYHTKSPWPAQLLNVWVLFLFFTHQSIHSRQLSENISYAKIVSAKLFNAKYCSSTSQSLKRKANPDCVCELSV